MYTELGDTRSYDVVREHFKILFKAVESNHGTVVKTIGDAVMAVFISPENALLAALETYKKFLEIAFPGPGHLEIKMGIHTGSAIAVSMNNKSDYFGNTVNLAARIQHETKDHAISFSQDYFDLPEIQGILKTELASLSLKIYRKNAHLKGIGDDVPVYSVRP
jgi:class 3 adenylate cyclase